VARLTENSSPNSAIACPGSVELEQDRPLSRTELGRLALRRPLARAIAIPSRVRIRSRSTSNSSESPIARAPETERARPVELGDHERVAFAERGRGAVEPRPGAVGAGQAVVEVDPLLGDPETAEDL
jgi:hypothetical protein